jgi:hypothetical protein
MFAAEHQEISYPNNTRSFAWAFYSDSKDYLFKVFQDSKMTWDEARKIGLGYWINTSNITVCVHLILDVYGKHCTKQLLA